MPHFTKRISTEFGALNFYFNRIFTVSGIQYHVSVTRSGASHYFMMHDGGHQWDFSDLTHLPQWIVELRLKLQEAIQEHLDNFPSPV